jgi:hypothetical protein
MVYAFMDFYRRFKTQNFALKQMIFVMIEAFRYRPSLFRGGLPPLSEGFVVSAGLLNPPVQRP